MSRVELAVEKVKHLDENQADFLLEWLELRESHEALRQRLDAEIEVGLEQLKRGEKIPNEQVSAEIRSVADVDAPGKTADHFYSPEAGATFWQSASISPRTTWMPPTALSRRFRNPFRRSPGIRDLAMSGAI